MEEKSKKVSLKDLIAKKLQKDERKNKAKEIYIKSLGGSVDFYIPDERHALETADMLKDDNFSNIYEASKNIIYHSCKMLRNPELHEQLKIVDPISVVSEIFDINEIIEIGSELLEFAGLTDKGLNEEIKN